MDGKHTSGVAITRGRDSDLATSDHDAESILEDFSDDATLAEIKAFIADLNEDEQVSLVALAWIGRGSFGADAKGACVASGRPVRASASIRRLR